MGILDNITKRVKKTAAKSEAKQSARKTEQKTAIKAENKVEKKPEAKKVEKKEDKKPAIGKKAADKPSFGPLVREFGGKSATVLLTPVLTEKSGGQESIGKYTFFISPKSTKVEVAEAIRDLYGVKPESVRIVSLKGKRVRFGRIQGKKKGRKKAIVTLKRGDSISLYE